MDGWLSTVAPTARAAPAAPMTVGHTGRVDDEAVVTDGQDVPSPVADE
ncbi:hypothetical protein ACWD5R_32340 [Streptomyces sp. NPDC002514]